MEPEWPSPVLSRRIWSVMQYPAWNTVHSTLSYGNNKAKYIIVEGYDWLFHGSPTRYFRLNVFLLEIVLYILGKLLYFSHWSSDVYFCFRIELYHRGRKRIEGGEKGFGKSFAGWGLQGGATFRCSMEETSIPDLYERNEKSQPCRFFFEGCI